MDDAFTPQLSAYLDEELTPAERLDVERHLLDCAHCRTVLDDLRDVVSDAAALESVDDDVQPIVWTRVRETIAPARSRRVSLSWMQALAAAATIALAAGGTVWVAIERGATTAPPPQAATAPSMSAPAGASAIPARFSDAEYDRAVADLTQVLETNRAKMSPRTVQVLERNLATIDRAIAEARAALAQDPSNAFLNEHLVDQRRVKLALLRQARDVVRAGP